MYSCAINVFKRNIKNPLIIDNFYAYSKLSDSCACTILSEIINQVYIYPVALIMFKFHNGLLPNPNKKLFNYKAPIKIFFMFL